MMSQRQKIYFPLERDEDDYPPVDVESLWGVPTASHGKFLLDNIPFFARAATLGDTILAEDRDGHWWFDRLIKPSGNSLIRIVLFDPSAKSRVVQRLEGIGCLAESFEEYHLLAVNVPSTSVLGAVQRVLRGEVNAGNLDYEEPLLRQ